jgi:hypothetical protein
MEEVFIHESVDLIVQWFAIAEFDVASLKMIDPIPARILNLGWKETLHRLGSDITIEGTRKF